MNKLLLIIVIFVFYSCLNIEDHSEKQVNQLNQNTDSIVASLKNINLQTIIYQREGKNYDIELMFYYPAEIWLSCNIFNKCLDTIFLQSKDSMFVYRKYNVYLTCNYNNEVINIYSYNNGIGKYIPPGMQYTLYAYIVDLPIFDSVYSNKEFTDFMSDFTQKAKFTGYINKSTYEDSTFVINTDSLSFIYYIDEMPIKIDSIGYPDSVGIFNKTVFGPVIAVY